MSHEHGIYELRMVSFQPNQNDMRQFSLSTGNLKYIKRHCGFSCFKHIDKLMPLPFSIKYHLVGSGFGFVIQSTFGKIDCV